MPSVVGAANRPRTQNGHIRNDTRDASRRISSPSNSPICRRNCVASDRACTRVTPQNLHGKEGVDGSSPSEGLHKSPANGHVVLPAMAKFRRLAGTRRVHFGTGGHSRAHATSRDAASSVLKRLDRDLLLKKLLQTGSRRCPCRRNPGPPPRERGSSGSRPLQT